MAAAVCIASPGARGAASRDRAAQFVDYDSDGLLDLLAWSADASGGCSGTSARRGATFHKPAPARRRQTRHGCRRHRARVALADLDGDGAHRCRHAGAGGVALWRNSGDGGLRRCAPVAIEGRVSNRLGIGAKVQMRAGSLSGAARDVGGDTRRSAGRSRVRARQTRPRCRHGPRAVALRHPASRVGAAAAAGRVRDAAPRRVRRSRSSIASLRPVRFSTPGTASGSSS